MGWSDRILYKVAKRDMPVILFLSPDTNDTIIAREGAFGGFVIRENLNEKFQLDKVDLNDSKKAIEHVKSILSQYIPFFIDRNTEGLNYEELSNEEKKAYEEALKSLPEEVRNEISYRRTFERETYTIREVEVSVTKVTSRYIVVEAKPKERGKRGSVKMVAVTTTLSRHQRVSKTCERFRLKYPECEALRYQLTWDTERSLVFRVITEKNLPTLPVIASIPQNEGTTRTPVLINGFLVISRLPSKALLDTSLPEIFKDTKIGKKEIRLVMGYFYNKLGTFARKFYTQILPKYAIDAGFGYIVPKENVSGFLEEVEMLKSEYREYEQQLKDFLLNGKIPEGLDRRSKIDPEYTEIVMEFLREHGKEDEVKERIENLDIAGRVRIDLLPFSVDMSILEEYVDERVKSMLEQKLYEIRSEMIENARKQLSKRIRDLAKKIEGLAKKTVTKKKIEELKKDVESVEKIARDLGVEFKEINVLKELLETPVEEIGMKVLKERTSGRLKALLDSL